MFPSEDEARVAAAVKLFLISYCGHVDTLLRLKVDVPRKPEHVWVQQDDGTLHEYVQFQDPVVIFDPGTLYPRGALSVQPTLVVGPLYRGKGCKGVFVPSQNWLVRESQTRLKMLPLW